MEISLPQRSMRLLPDQLRQGNTGQNGLTFALLRSFLPMKLLRLTISLGIRKIRRLLAIALLPFKNGGITFLREKRMKQHRLPKSGMIRVLPTKTKCLCEFDLLFLKGF
jgi:hypothetical protein